MGCLRQGEREAQRGHPVKTRDLLEWAVDKPRFGSVDDYIAFGRAFLDFRAGGNFQAELIARNDHKYQFLQYRDDAVYHSLRNFGQPS